MRDLNHAAALVYGCYIHPYPFIVSFILAACDRLVSRSSSLFEIRWKMVGYFPKIPPVQLVGNDSEHTLCSGINVQNGPMRIDFDDSDCHSVEDSRDRVETYRMHANLLAAQQGPESGL